MTNFRIIYWKYCNICGSTHETECCSFLQNVEIVRDTFALTRARLSLPKGLEVMDFVDGSTSVIARNQFKCGVQFGPMIANKTSNFNVTSNFPMKIFSEDVPSDKIEDCLYLDTSNEHLCNWMCFVAPATCLEEQNLICFQMKNEVYFLVVKDIEPGEQLHVWYAPQYGVEMAAKQLESSSSINEEFLPAYVEEPILPATNYISPAEKKKKNKLKSRAKSINCSPEQRNRLVSKLPSAILGAKNPKSEWDCAKCDFKSKSLPEYAKHLMTHREAVEKFQCCSCQKVFATRKGLENHQKSKVCNKTGTQSDRTEDPNISPSVDDLDKTCIENNNKDLTEYDKTELDHSDMSNVHVLLQAQENHQKIKVCNNSGIQSDRNEDPKISSSVDNIDETSIGTNNNGDLTEYDKTELDHSDVSNVLDSLTDSTSMKKLLLTDSSRLITCSEKDSPFSKEYDIFLDSLTDFKPNNSSILSDSNLLSTISLKNDTNNVDSFTCIKNEVRVDVGAQSHKEIGSDNPPILGLGDEIVFQDIKVFADISNEVEKGTDFSNGLAFDSNPQNNDVHPLETSDKAAKIEQTVDSNDLDLDLLCEERLHDTGQQVGLVDNLINATGQQVSIVGNLINENETRLNEISCVAAPLTGNVSSMVSAEGQAEFVDQNTFEQIDLTLDFSTPAEKTVTVKKPVKLDKIYGCEICYKKFSKPVNLRRHLKIHTGEFTCIECMRVFARKETLENHTCSDVSYFRCNLCSCEFKTKIEIKNHWKLHSNDGDTKYKETKLKLTAKMFEDLEMSVNSCTEMTNNKMQLLDSHKEFSIKESSNKEYICELCGAQYKTARGLSYHRLIHNSEKCLTCYVCDKKFHRKSVLENHMTSHVKQKKSCSICKSVFSSEKSLRAHMRRHSARLIFKCDNCDKTFTEKANLIKHKKSQHQNNEKLENRQKLAQDKTCRPSQQKILISSDHHPPKRRNKTGSRQKKSLNKNEEYICRYCHTILNNRNSLNRHLRVKHQNSKKEWSVPEIVDSMRVVIEETAAVKSALRISQVDLEPILAVVTADDNSVVTDSEAAAIQPSTSEAVENPPDPIANQLPSLDCSFTLKTENNQDSDVIGYQPLIQPLNAAELFQIEGNDTTPALILEDSSVVQSGIPLDKELFYLVYTPESETIIPI